MKIACLSTFYPFRGGIAQFNALLYRAFEKNNSVEAYTFKRQYPEMLFPGKTQYVTPEDTADAIPAKRVLDTINPLTYFKTARLIRQQQPDLLLVKYWMTFFAPSLGFVAQRVRPAKRIAILDNVIPHERRFFDHFLNRYFLKRYDGFVVMSDKVLHDLQHYRPEARYIRVNHPVYDHFGEHLDRADARRKLQLDPDKKILLFFGIIRDYKGLNVLLDTLARLDDSYHLLIAGEVYGSFDKYEEQIRNLNLAHRIALHTHYIADSEVNLYFSAADVCMLTYVSATQSGITSISNHFQLPIIATDVGGLKETILHEQTGLIVPEVDPDQIARAVNHYFEARLYQQFHDKIGQYNAENSWDNFVEKILQFAREL